jgi:hypothetical protein
MDDSEIAYQGWSVARHSVTDVTGTILPIGININTYFTHVQVSSECCNETFSIRSALMFWFVSASF